MIITIRSPHGEIIINDEQGNEGIALGRYADQTQRIQELIESAANKLKELAGDEQVNYRVT